MESPARQAPAALPLTLVVKEKDAGTRLDRFIKKRYPKLPIGVVFKLLRKRRITVGGKRSQANIRLAGGQTVEIREHLEGYTLPPGEHLRKAARSRDSGHFRKNFEILHEDSSIVVLNKPVGIVVHPGPGHHKGDTLLDLLKAYLPDSFVDDSPFRPAFVHRLDRGTSGVLVAAKTRDAATALETALRTHLARKTYLTLATGTFRRSSGKIDYPLRHMKTHADVSRFVAVKDKQQKKQLAGRMQSALTFYRRKEQLEGAALLEIETETGRTHQIRAHLEAIGHSLVGDGDYGKRLVNREFRSQYGVEHILLHAARIELPHPETGEKVTFEAPLPAAFARVVERLRAATKKKRDERRTTEMPRTQRGMGKR